MTIAQWLLAKGFINESARSGGILVAYRTHKNRPLQHVVLDGAQRPKRKRSMGVGVWHENGAKLYLADEGRVVRGPRPSEELVEAFPRSYSNPLGPATSAVERPPARKAGKSRGGKGKGSGSQSQWLVCI